MSMKKLKLRKKIVQMISKGKDKDSIILALQVKRRVTSNSKEVGGGNTNTRRALAIMDPK